MSNRRVAGGYIYVLSTVFANTSADDYLAIADEISDEVRRQSGGETWELLHLYTPVDFQLGHSGVVASLQIWFDAKAETFDAAMSSRELLIGFLCESLTSMRLPDGTSPKHL